MMVAECIACADEAEGGGGRRDGARGGGTRRDKAGRGGGRQEKRWTRRDEAGQGGTRRDEAGGAARTLTMSMSAPSATSSAASMSASRPLAGSCWYVFLSPKPGWLRTSKRHDASGGL